jgi:hypothetical protein
VALQQSGQHGLYQHAVANPAWRYDENSLHQATRFRPVIPRKAGACLGEISGFFTLAVWWNGSLFSSMVSLWQVALEFIQRAAIRASRLAQFTYRDEHTGMRIP